MKGNSQRFTDAGRGAGDPDFTVVVRSTQHSALSIQQLVFGSRYLVLGTWYLVFGIWYFHVLVCPMEKHVRNIDIPDFETTQTPAVRDNPIYLRFLLRVSVAPWCKGLAFISPPRFRSSRHREIPRTCRRPQDRCARRFRGFVSDLLRSWASRLRRPARPSRAVPRNR